MKMFRIFLAAVVLAWFLPVSAGAGGNDWLDWFRAANPHLRTAISYLRTGNVDIAALALEDLLAIEQTPEDAGKPVASIRAALDAIDADEPEKARKMLLAVRAELYARNRAGKLDLMEDCVWQLRAAGKPLWYFRKHAPDLKNSTQAMAVLRASKDYLAMLDKCDSMATAGQKATDIYARLVKGAQRSLRAIPAAVRAKDGGQLFRYLIELRSFDRLIYFHYG